MYTLTTLALTAATALSPMGAVEKSMIIVVTEDLRTRSAKLEAFVAEKERRGFTVLVATENDFGGEGVTGMEKALLIRQYLQSIHTDYSFLLLIGDSHPTYGEVPMFKVWPRHELLPTNCHGFALDCRSCETDYMYADLTGNWDLNGNGQYGETGLDEGEGGIDFEPELIVGRIPTFFDDVRELDQVLQHAMDYMNQSVDATGYRRKMLLPASFYYFEGQQMVNYVIPENVDGADTAEWFIHNVLDPHPEISVTRMYEMEGHVTSAHDCEIPLTEENFINEWSTGYGMVFWFGHGLDRKVARTIWVDDTNSNGEAESTEMQSELMIHSDDAEHIGSGNPAFVAAVSCEVGSADTPYNLSYSLLLHGAAIGMLGSNSVTPGAATDWLDPESELDTTRTGGDNVGIRFYELLIQGKSGGEAFYEAKVQLGSAGSAESLAGRMMINYFGDPSLTLGDSAADAPLTVDPTNPATGKGSGGCSAAGRGSLPSVLLLALAFLLLACVRKRMGW